MGVGDAGGVCEWSDNRESRIKQLLSTTFNDQIKIHNVYLLWSTLFSVIVHNNWTSFRGPGEAQQQFIRYFFQ